MIFGRGRGGWRRRGRRGWGGRNVGRTGCPARSARGAHRRAEVGRTRQSCSGRGGGEGIDRVEEDKPAVVGGFGVVESGRLALALGLAGWLGVWSRPRSRLGGGRAEAIGGGPEWRPVCMQSGASPGLGDVNGRQCTVQRLGTGDVVCRVDGGC